MAMHYSCPLFFCFLLSLPIAVTDSTVSASINLLGVSPQDADYYRSSPVISCKDGFGSFHVDRLNDDFCDCFDGTDEPGTSACPNGRFHCKNQNHSPLWIFSSRVNDGICDCCDGSDEYEREINCVLSCPKDNDDDQGAGKKAGKKAVKEMVPILLQSNKLKLGSWKPERKSLKNAVHKLRDLKILMVMEMGLVFLLLYQFYRWSRRRGSNLRKRLP